jgi:phosphate transport system protein
MSEHIFRQFDQELNHLRAKVLEMGGAVEEQMANAISALIEQDRELAEKVVYGDAPINRLEREIDEETVHLIVRRQPAASDLRLLIASMKITTDLERIGDEANKIGRMAKLILEGDRLTRPQFSEIRAMAMYARDMLRKALDAYARLDITDAVELTRDDQAIDESFRFVMRGLVTFMLEDPRLISLALEVLWVAKALERVGDHTKNIGEYIIYAAKGEDVRHTSLANLEKDAFE